MVLAHHGTIAAEDAPGGGARFTVRLPRIPAPPPGASPASADEARAGIEPGPEPHG